MRKYELQLSSSLNLMSLGLIEYFLKERNAIFADANGRFKFKFEPSYDGKEMIGIAILREEIPCPDDLKKAE